MRSLVIGIVSASLFQPIGPAYGQVMSRLQPSSQWIVEYADEDCRLIRNFGTGDDRVILALDQSSPGDWFGLLVVGKRFGSGNLASKPKPKFRFSPNELPQQVDGYTAIQGGLPAFLAGQQMRVAPLTAEQAAAQEAAAKEFKKIELPPIGPERELAVTSIEIVDLLKSTLVLETGSMRASLEALRNCSWDSVRTWGLDVEQQKVLSRRAAPIKQGKLWISHEDYPSRMIESGEQGLVKFRAIVDAEGKPESCAVQRTSRPKDFGDLVCRLVMSRLRFDPALDAQGKPVRSFYVQQITFRIQQH